VRHFKTNEHRIGMDGLANARGGKGKDYLNLWHRFQGRRREGTGISFLKREFDRGVKGKIVKLFPDLPMEGTARRHVRAERVLCRFDTLQGERRT